MNRNMLVVGAAIAAVAVAGGASAKMTHPHRMASASGKFAAPSQPIPYDQMDAYVNGGARKKAAILASAGWAPAAAATGAASDTSATAPVPASADNAMPAAPAAGAMTTDTTSAPAAPATPDAATPAPVNPPAAAPAAPESTATPPK